MRWLIVLLCLVACTPRELARVGGDSNGVPVAVTVHYDHTAAEAMTHNAGFLRTVVIERDPWPYSPFYCHPYAFAAYGPAWGPRYAYEPSTSLYLLIGRGPAEGQYLRLELDAATWNGSIPITAGQEVIVSLQASGGRSGWKELGRFIATADQQITVRLEGAEPRVETQTPAP